MVNTMKIITMAAVGMLLFYLSLFASCGSAELQSKNGNATTKGELGLVKRNDIDVISQLRQKKLKTFGEWDVGEDSPYLYFVEETDGGDRLQVINSNYEILYEKTLPEISRVYGITALRKPYDQLVFEYHEGGNDYFVQMLDLVSGKVSEQIYSAKADNTFSANIVIQPQFRSGVDPAKEPFEVLLTDFGLPSAAGKYTKVLRYKEGMYRLIGEFDRAKAAEFIENNLNRR